MATFMAAFKLPLNRLLGEFQGNEEVLLPVSGELVADLRVWAAVIVQATSWMPIAREMVLPDLGHIVFISDAAGGVGTEEWTGVASVGVHPTDNHLWYVCQKVWPQGLMDKVDEKGAAFRSKTTTLEMVGLLLPFLTVPRAIQNRNVVLGVDNIACVYAWQKRRCKGDIVASVLVRALHILSSFLEARVFVKHIPRKSSEASTVADGLTRESSDTLQIRDRLGRARWGASTPALNHWLEDPAVDWKLGLKLVEDVKSNL
jgi:hypothetical protein